MTKLTAKSQLNMTTFMANADLLGLFQAAEVTIHTSTTFQIHDVEDTDEVLTLTGTFGGYGSGEYPTTGTITGGTYTPGNTGFPSITFSGASMSVEDFTAYVNENDVSGLFEELLAGADHIIGSASADELYGFAGNDQIDGKGGADKLIGGLGNDTYVIDNGGDVVVERSGQGSDLVKSKIDFTLGNNVERLALTGTAAIEGTGNNAANTITGNGSANVLSGRGANDTIKGGAGADDLHGGLGNDRLTGGSGLDDFYFDTALSSSNLDKILDFVAAEDAIKLDMSVFSAIAAGKLAAGAFRLGTAAADANDRIIYDSATGKIYYDADGSGGGAKVLFAQVTAWTTLTNADFIGVAATTTSRTTSVEKDGSSEWQASDLFSFESETLLPGGEFAEPAHMLAQEHWSQMQQIQRVDWSSVDYFSS
jgi:Ca2+-binding RTX toxin-like protein